MEANVTGSSRAVPSVLRHMMTEAACAYVGGKIIGKVGGYALSKASPWVQGLVGKLTRTGVRPIASSGTLAPKPSIQFVPKRLDQRVRMDSGGRTPSTLQRVTHAVDNPGRIQSRINIREGEVTNKTPGWKNAWRKHGESAKPNKSQFTISETEAKALLREKVVINAPVKLDPDTGSYVREVDLGRTIGSIMVPENWTRNSC